MVRSGEITARELVEASLVADRGAQPDAQRVRRRLRRRGARRRRRRSRPATTRPFAGVPIAIKNNRPVAGKRLTFASSLFGDFAPPIEHRARRAAARGRLRSSSARPTLPEFGILADDRAAALRRRRATRGTRRARRAARPAARRRRSPPAWSRSPTPTTAAARRASRPRAAGSSASSRSAGGSRSAPLRRRVVPRRRRRASRARRGHRAIALDVLAGLRARRRDLGAAARPSRSPRRPARAPERLRIAMTTLTPVETATGRPRRSRAPSRRPPRCCADSATRSSRPTRRGAIPALVELFDGRSGRR